jgi:acyl-CoA thioesterase YciA
MTASGCGSGKQAPHTESRDGHVKLPDEEPAPRWIMSQVDVAGAVPAYRRARGRIATVAVNSFVFKQPVMIGDLVSFYARITRVGRTSITVDVEVFAQRNWSDESCVRVTEASLTYVAVDADRRPRELPPE